MDYSAMESLEDIIKAQIRDCGPMSVAAYMELALGHPTYGYYITRDPLGAAGDFTTAPEISQLFGEMIGLCMADAWLRAGSTAYALVELGPGRGTLTADLLRATKIVPAFHEKLCGIELVETSPALRLRQAETLASYSPHWHDTIDTLPTDAPLLIIANEFFDALPVHQATMTTEGLKERVIGLDDNGALCIGFGSTLPYDMTLEIGKTIEFSPARESVMANLAQKIAKQGGMLLAIDYGHDTAHPVGDTFQALYRHMACHPFDHIGHADLTSHVDFYRLKAIAKENGCVSLGSVSQKQFLETLGIEALYARYANEKLKSGKDRILAADGMGSLFRVLAVTAPPLFPAGFGNQS